MHLEQQRESSMDFQTPVKHQNEGNTEILHRSLNEQNVNAQIVGLFCLNLNFDSCLLSQSSNFFKISSTEKFVPKHLECK